MALKTILLRNLFKQVKISNFTPCLLQNRKEYKQKHSNRTWNTTNTTVGLLASVVIGSVVTDKEDDCKSKNKVIEAGEKRADLPTYRAEEVSKHDNKESFWVTYKHGVYDVTSFLPSHPGGEQIFNAAGLSVEPFWNVYGMHKTKEVYALLESYRIDNTVFLRIGTGNLHDDDVADHSDEEMWAREPVRDRRLRVKTQRPFNAETPPHEHVLHFDTPNELFYVRQHMPVPDLDERTHKLKVVVVDEDGTTKQTEFSLQDLEQFPTTSVRAALMCAGNRRTDMNKVKLVKGLDWTTGAIGNAVWSGVLLRDVLLAAGVQEQDVDGRHVILTGADMDATGTWFSTSIPLVTALDASGRVLLASRMNGAALAPDHGRPLRAVVPGAPAVRSVKWLQTITVSKEQSSSHWHQKDYRSFGPGVTWETADFPSAPPVYSLPVTSAVCSPADGDTVRAEGGTVRVTGYAYSGGGAKIMRVEVSCDRGVTWLEADLQCDSAPPRQHYSWTLWSIALPATDKQMEIWVKATDSNFNAQPENFDHIWNIRGILSNAYHKIKINIIQ